MGFEIIPSVVHIPGQAPISIERVSRAVNYDLEAARVEIETEMPEMEYGFRGRAMYRHAHEINTRFYARTEDAALIAAQPLAIIRVLLDEIERLRSDR